METVVKIKVSMLEKICEYLHGHCDEGPYYGGWQSEELINLIADIEVLLGKDPKYIWRGN